MMCQNCGSEIPEGACACVNCGTVVQETVVTPANEKPAAAPGQIMGIVSLVLGILSILSGCCCSFIIGFFSLIAVIPFAIAGVITGVIALKQAKEANTKNVMAIVGIVCSALGILSGLVYVILFVGILGLGAATAYTY